jgi:hypothetical protein
MYYFIRLLFGLGAAASYNSDLSSIYEFLLVFGRTAATYGLIVHRRMIER